MISFAQNKQLGSGDLNILIRDETGVLFDPSFISYSIFSVDPDTNAQSLVSLPDSVPSRTGTGIYYVNMTIPSVWLGKYMLVWKIARYANLPFDTLYEDFQIVSFTPGTSSNEAPSVFITQKPGMSQAASVLVSMVRELLSDTNPDRNYHFRPPTPGKAIAGFTARAGFIWTDDTVIRMLQLALAQMNMINPLNTYNYNLDTAPDSWGKIACLGAAAKCLSAEGCRWAADEFSYSLNGISLDINKSSTYMQLAEAYKAEFNEMATQAAANRPASAGLRQQRWLI